MAAVASAHERVYVATLNGTTETPANDSLGVGTAVVSLDLDLFTMRVEVEFSGLTGTVDAAHIHGNTTQALAGNADVMTPAPTFPGFPSGVHAGVYDHTLDLTQAASYNPSFIAASGGTISLASDALFDGLDAGTTYLNIHTSAFGGGEIRGFLLPTWKADFTHDGIVDAEDLDVWNESFALDHEADANDDEATAGDDFLIWQEQFGLEASLEAGDKHAIAVPEPHAAGLVAVIGTIAAVRARQQSKRARIREF